MLWLVQSQAASFDCTKASSFSEMAICNSFALSKLDDELNDMYGKAIKITNDKKGLKQQSVKSWRWREKNCHTSECLYNWYAQRKMALEKIVNKYKSEPIPKVQVIYIPVIYNN